jgi:hypothetical protein
VFDFVYFFTFKFISFFEFLFVCGKRIAFYKNFISSLISIISFLMYLSNTLLGWSRSELTFFNYLYFSYLLDRDKLFLSKCFFVFFEFSYFNLFVFNKRGFNLSDYDLIFVTTFFIFLWEFKITYFSDYLNLSIFYSYFLFLYFNNFW